MSYGKTKFQFLEKFLSISMLTATHAAGDGGVQVKVTMTFSVFAPRTIDAKITNTSFSVYLFSACFDGPATEKRRPISIILCCSIHIVCSVGRAPLPKHATRAQEPATARLSYELHCCIIRLESPPHAREPFCLKLFPAS